MVIPRQIATARCLVIGLLRWWCLAGVARCCCNRLARFRLVGGRCGVGTHLWAAIKHLGRLVHTGGASRAGDGRYDGFARWATHFHGFRCAASRSCCRRSGSAGDFGCCFCWRFSRLIATHENKADAHNDAQCNALQRAGIFFCCVLSVAGKHNLPNEFLTGVSLVFVAYLRRVFACAGLVQVGGVFNAVLDLSNDLKLIFWALAKVF